MKFNLYDEVKDLAQTVKAGGDLYDLNKQADLVLDLIENEEALNQSAIDYLNNHYDIQDGYCTCENEDSLIARLFAIRLAHGFCITTESNRTEQEIVDACVDAAEEHFSSTRLNEIEYLLKEYALINEPYSSVLREPEKRTEYAVEELNVDGDFEYQWDVCNSIREADDLINSILVEKKSSSSMRFRITRIDYEDDKEVSSETVKEVTI